MSVGPGQIDVRIRDEAIEVHTARNGVFACVPLTADQAVWLAEQLLTQARVFRGSTMRITDMLRGPGGG